MTSRASASVAMALDDLRQLFEGAKRSVFRLETLPVYEVGEDIERQRAFAAEGRLPPPSPDRVAFIRRMQERTRRVAWSRVHVVDQPLTPYLRNELAAYAENERAGVDRRAGSPSWPCRSDRGLRARRRRGRRMVPLRRARPAHRLRARGARGSRPLPRTAGSRPCARRPPPRLPTPAPTELTSSMTGPDG